MTFDLILTKDEISPSISFLLSRWAFLAELQYQVRGIVMHSVNEAYETQGHGSWPPRKQPYKHPMLQETGRMRRAQVMAAGHIRYARQRDEHVFDLSGIVGATGISAFHHFGTKNMPARSTIDITPEQADELQSLVEAHLFNVK